MASPFYSKVIGVITPYIGPEKAVMAVQRNLERCGATIETFDAKHFSVVVNYVVGATYIWLDQDADKQKKAELAAKLRALA
jgi:hypothetical protein